PEGFAHGFQTLAQDSALLYHHTEFYTPGAEGGLRYDDPILAITWPLPVTVISERDARHPVVDKNFKGI
ncbi:MAG TPA: dTDP-4-dehydrorhamnose 3,5-epimerase family protein, partial [Puia sp.]|nr:dTDP-4-dehydrorhamnose 3,5-epimerase family protein [Puia sp.]